MMIINDDNKCFATFSRARLYQHQAADSKVVFLFGFIWGGTSTNKPKAEGWFHFFLIHRPSGTEDVVRVYAEADTQVIMQTQNISDA